MVKTQQITKVDLFPVSLELLLLSSRIVLGYFQEEFKATFLQRGFRAHAKSEVKRGIPHVQSLKVIPETPDDWSGEGGEGGERGGERGGVRSGRRKNRTWMVGTEKD